MTARTGKVGPDNHGRTTRDKTAEIKTVGTGKPRQEAETGQAQTGQPKQDSPDRTAMTEQPRWDSCDGIAWLSQPGQDRTRQSRQDMY